MILNSPIHQNPEQKAFFVVIFFSISLTKAKDSDLYRYELQLKEVASFLNHQNEVLNMFFEEQSLLLKK